MQKFYLKLQGPSIPPDFKELGHIESIAKNFTLKIIYQRHVLFVRV